MGVGRPACFVGSVVSLSLLAGGTWSLGLKKARSSGRASEASPLLLIELELRAYPVVLETETDSGGF